MKNLKIKKVASTAIATCMIATSTINVFASSFTDLKDSHWAKRYIDEFVTKGYIKGYPQDGTFRPDNSIKRAEFITIVNKMFEFSSGSTENFSDVESSQWFYNEVCTAIKAGYIKGYGDGTFRPDDNITRQEAAVIITSIKNNKDSKIDAITKYKDASNISQWAREYVEGAVEAGYMNGYDDNTLRPINNITRAESVTMLSMVENKADTNITIMYTTADPLNVRSGPSTSNSKIGTLPRGSKVEVVSKSNGWAKIKYDNDYAYVSVDYLSEVPVDNTDTNVKIMYTTTDSLNVRSGPSTSDNKIGTLPEGSKVEVVSESDGWAKIKYNNSYAYVSIDYLTESLTQKPLPSVPYTPKYVDVPQNQGIIDSSQDIYQSKIQFNVQNANGVPAIISLASTDNSFGVDYKVYYDDGSYLSASNGNNAGSTTKGNIKGLKISLNNAPENYSIFYRTKIKDQGWQAWVKDGELSGEIKTGATIEGIEVRLIVSESADSMVNEKIAIDIGHNVARSVGSEPVTGAISGIYVEDELTKIIGEKVIYKLREQGYNVISTLPKGTYSQTDELSLRADIANSNEVDKFISIHFNKVEDPGANGTEVWYSDRVGSLEMAEDIAANIADSFGTKNRNELDEKEGNFAVLNKTVMPAVLVESLFISSSLDMDKFIEKGSNAYDVMADAIVNGIIGNYSLSSL